MIDALSSAAAGIYAGARGFDKAAQKVVQAAVPGTASGDLPAAIVDTQMSALQFKAGVAAFRIADKTIGALLDTIA